MGIGDEIIASGHAKRLFEKHGKRVMICDVHGQPRWSAMWQGINWIAHPVTDRDAPDIMRLRNGPRCRPYIDYKKGFTRRGGLNYSGWRCQDHRGFIQLTDHEMRNAAALAKELGRFTIIEPLVKSGANPNKQWGRHKWQELADLLIAEGMNPIQIGGEKTTKLDGVRHVFTSDFRYGVALMKFSRWNFLPDGGLHHAAAALGLPASVLWGGTNDPGILGYPEHVNVFFPAVCGKWMPCGHCRAIWNWLSASYVWEVTLPQLKERYREDYRSR